MLDTVLIVWFVLVGISAAYVGWDAYWHNPELVVMKWGWVLVTLYTGPVALSWYILTCKEPAPGQHEEFIRPLWKQAFGSTIHCLAGDATGVIVAAAVTESLGLPMWLDIIAEYAFGFAFGLTIFQALFMKDMLGGSYIRALRSSLIPEWLSMNTVMAGMIPVMVILMTRNMAAMSATSIRFWGIMSLAILIGGIVAYPVNVWLVAKGLKHGMGTVRALGEGGHSLAAEREAVTVATGYRAVAAATHASPGHAGSPPVMPDNASKPGNPHAGMEMRSTVTRPQVVAVALLTLEALAAGTLLAAVFGNFLATAGAMR